MASAADFAGATVQERFSIMMNERIGNVEGAIRELRGALADVCDMLADVRDFVTTDVVYCTIDVPKMAHPEIGPAFLDRLIDAVQKTRRVDVDAARCSMYSEHDLHYTTVFLHLKAPIILSRATHEMNEHIVAAFPSLVSIHAWRS
jgi:hypothetical protein